MKLIPIAFDSETSPWRVILPTALTHGKRKAKYFATKKEADDFCKIANKPGFTLDGFVPAVPKSKQDEFAVAIRQFAALYDGKISNAYVAHERLQKLQNIRPATVREAVEAFQAWRQTQVGIKWGQSTVTQDRYRLVKLIRKFERVPLVDLTTVALREFFDETTGDPRSIYSSVHTFFDWAVKRQYLVENPIAPIEAKETGEYGINNDYYPVETFRRMLLIAAGLEPVKKGGQTTKALRDLLPWFVVSGFLGLRSCEARRENRNADSIRWSDLHFDAEVPYVEVRASVVKGRMGKPRKSRYIETSHYLEAAKAWLEYYGKPETDGPIVRWTKRQIQELKRDFKKATGLRFTENGFRNSFATYALTFNGLQGIGKLALEMGDSEAVCNRHYVRSIAPGSGRAWFSLRPFEVVSSPAAVMA
jgi:site-specific recombinase XerC